MDGGGWGSLGEDQAGEVSAALEPGCVEFWVPPGPLLPCVTSAKRHPFPESQSPRPLHGVMTAPHLGAGALGGPVRELAWSLHRMRAFFPAVITMKVGGVISPSPRTWV